VPLDRDNDSYVDHSWAVLLFDRVSEFWAANPQTCLVYLSAFESYLDSTSKYVEVDYIRLQIALEAFAYWHLRFTHRDERVIVKDKQSWKAWVKSNAASIQEHAAEGFENSLLNKVRDVYHQATGRVVVNAFQSHGMALTDEMKTELEKRNTAVHQGLAGSDQNDPMVDRRGLRIVRTLLVALVAKSVNYSGAINGWEAGRLGHFKQPDSWWTVVDEDRRAAIRTFDVDANTN
jgi:hypothetical protein